MIEGVFGIECEPGEQCLEMGCPALFIFKTRLYPNVNSIYFITQSISLGKHLVSMSAYKKLKTDRNPSASITIFFEDTDQVFFSLLQNLLVNLSSRRAWGLINHSSYHKSGKKMN